MLTTSNEYSKIFLNRSRLLLDSCILNDWSTDQSCKLTLDKAESQYNFLMCTISMLEVGFGPRTASDPGQVTIAKSIYHSENVMCVDNLKISEIDKFEAQVMPGRRYSYNPNHHEYLAARTNLILLMEKRSMGGKRARELSNDALIYFCAWNSRSAIITNNITDFSAFNEIMSEKNPKHLIPIYSIYDLSNSFISDVSFPENLPSP